MLLRASGREVTAIELPAKGLPHVNMERAELLNALAATLPDDAAAHGVRCADLHALADDYDLVVVADGANSALGAAVSCPPANGGRGPSGKPLSPPTSRRYLPGRARA
jgi:hypothetical protein